MAVDKMQASLVIIAIFGIPLFMALICAGILVTDRYLKRRNLKGDR